MPIATTEQLTFIEPEYSFTVYSENELADLIKIERYNKWLAKRDQDSKYCGTYHGIPNVLKGGAKYYSRSCNEPHCDKCGPRIREQMKHNLTIKLKQSPLNKITLTGTTQQQKDIRAKILREFGKNNVMVSVNTDNNNVLSYSTDIIINGDINNKVKSWLGNNDTQQIITRISDDDILLWSAKSPHGKAAGTLHKKEPSTPSPKEKTKEDDKINMVTISHVTSYQTDSYDVKLLNQIEVEVLKQTSNLNPKTAHQLTKALNEQYKIREQLLNDNGIVILSNRYNKLQVNITNVCWQPVKSSQNVDYKGKFELLTENDIPF